MSTYERGWYLAERNGATESVFIHGSLWYPLDYDGLSVGQRTEDLTDIRPAIVLDPNDEDVQMFAEDGSGSLYRTLRQLAAKIAAQMPEPKPERIPEPGRLGVVQSETILHAARYFMNLHGSWYAVTSAGGGRPWTDLIDPVLVHPGEGDVP